MTTPPLTRTIGATERTLRDLLENRLAAADISFAEWTVLVFLQSGDPVETPHLLQRLAAGRIAARDEAVRLLADMEAAGLILRGGHAPDGTLVLSPRGRDVARPLFDEIGAITRHLEDGIDPGELAATRRTLDMVAGRAAALLSAG